MSEKKNIDRIFQEKFRNFEQSPDDRVWERIDATLHADKDKRKPVAIWWKLAGVAAALLLLFTISQFYFSDPSADIEESSPLVESNEKEQSSPDGNSSDIRTTTSGQEDEMVNNETIQDDSEIKKNALQTEANSTLVSNEKIGNESNNVGITSSPVGTKKDKTSYPIAGNPNNGRLENLGTNSSPSSNSETNKSTDGLAKQNSKPGEPSGRLADAEQNRSKTVEEVSSPTALNATSGVANENTTTQTLTEHPTDVTKSEETLSEENALADADLDLEDSIEKEKESPKPNRWNISPNVSPVYFNSLGTGSSLDGQFNDNSKSGDINFSYGISGSYAISEKIKVRAGVNNVTLGYRTNDVILTQGLASAQVSRLSHVNMRSEVEASTTIMSASQLNTSAIPDIIFANPKGSLDQELGFIEVPLEIEYSLIDNLVGLNLIGGFSTYFLNKNEVYSTLQGERQFLGEANNINDVSYSANFGLGVDFHLTPKWDLSFEPTFKYQMGTFSDSSGDFRPYFIGLYSGVRFKF